MTDDMADLFLRDLRDRTEVLAKLPQPIQSAGAHDAAFAH